MLTRLLKLPQSFQMNPYSQLSIAEPRRGLTIWSCSVGALIVSFGFRRWLTRTVWAGIKSQDFWNHAVYASLKEKKGFMTLTSGTPDALAGLLKGWRSNGLRLMSGYLYNLEILYIFDLTLGQNKKKWYSLKNTRPSSRWLILFFFRFLFISTAMTYFWLMLLPNRDPVSLL